MNLPNFNFQLSDPKALRQVILGVIASSLFASLQGAHKSIFVAGGLFNEQVAALRNSGFDTALLWSVHVNGAAALSLNNDLLIDANGNYVYGQWARNNCAKLKQAPTSITRIEFSVGAFAATDFENIEAWVNSGGPEGGTGPNSRLRRNFQALKDAFPEVDAINFDDESNYDLASSTAFAIMLVDLGYKITFCPYTRRTTFWGPLYEAIEAARPGAVEHIYLQRYAGGGLNNPASWNGFFGPLKVEPGLWAGDASTTGRRDPSEVEADMNAWRNSADIPGGFIWRLNFTSEGGHSVQDYAAAIDGVYTSQFDETVFYQIINQHSGKALAVFDENLAGSPANGTANGAEIAQADFKVNDDRFYWAILDLGNGHRGLINKYSGKAAAVFSSHLDGVTTLAREENFADIGQWDYLGDDWYQWRIAEVESGYKITSRHSEGAMTVFSRGTGGGFLDNSLSNADVAQHSYTGQPWYHWDIIEIRNLRISSIATSGNLIQITAEGAKAGTNVSLQSSPSLNPATWQTQETKAAGSNGQATFSRLRPADSSYFYRITN